MRLSISFSRTLYFFTALDANLVQLPLLGHLGRLGHCSLPFSSLGLSRMSFSLFSVIIFGIRSLRRVEVVGQKQLFNDRNGSAATLDQLIENTEATACGSMAHAIIGFCAVRNVTRLDRASAVQPSVNVTSFRSEMPP